MIFPLRLKLALVTSALLGLAIGTVSVLVLRQTRQALEEEARKRGVALAVNLARNARVPLLEQDDVVLSQLLRTIAEEDEILGAQLVGASEELVASAGSQAPPPSRWLEANQEIATRTISGNLGIASRITFDGIYVGEAQILLDLDGIIEPVLARAREDVGLASGGLLGIGILLAFFISARTTRPLRRLRLAANALAAGELPAHVEPTTRDEIADLTRAFNEMSESLRQKKRVEIAFRRYVSDHVLRGVLEPSEAGALRGEEREVTVLFIDIRNFTRITGQLKPEKLIAFLDESFDIITNRLLENGATVDKYMGDAILAYFGAPVEMADHPERGVAAAIAIQRSAEDRNRKLSAGGGPFVRLELGIGIHTGRVVVGNIGSDLKMDYTAIGDPVNVASRLQHLARPGEILVTSEVARRLGKRLKLESMGEKRLAGREAPVEAYRIVYSELASPSSHQDA